MYDESLVAFLYRHASTLQHLSVGELRLDLHLLKALAHCSPLQRLNLHIHHVKATPEQWIEYHDQLWSHVHTLHYIGPAYMYNVRALDLFTLQTRFQETCGPTALQEIQILLKNPDIQTVWLFLCIIMKSPRLVRLQWDVLEGFHPLSRYFYVGPTAWLAQGARTRHMHCPLLASLTLYVNHLPVQGFNVVLKTLTGLQKLDLQMTNFGQEHCQVLIHEVPRCRTTLTFLDLTKCKLLKEEDVHDLLCAISSLETFRAPYRSSLSDPRPWVCLGMKDLTLDPLELEPMILGRLEILKQLVLWNGCLYPRPPYIYEGLDL